MTGIELIAAERQRQIYVEGWTASDDAAHKQNELVKAAVTYLMFVAGIGIRPPIWPWSKGWWKPKGRRRNLVRAGALIAAELDRMGPEEPPETTDAADAAAAIEG